MDLSSNEVNMTADEGIKVGFGDKETNKEEYLAGEGGGTLTKKVIGVEEEHMVVDGFEGSIQQEYYTDKLGNGKFSFIADRDTKIISKAVLSSPGIYMYDVPDDRTFYLEDNPVEGAGDFVAPEFSFARSFALQRPPEQKGEYTIYFNSEKKPFLYPDFLSLADKNSAFVDLKNNKISLRGVINYQRKGFRFLQTPTTSSSFVFSQYEDGEEVSSERETFTFYPITPFFFHLTDVINSFDEDNQFVLSFVNPVQAEVEVSLHPRQNNKVFTVFFDDVRVDTISQEGSLSSEWRWTEQKPNAIIKLESNELHYVMKDDNRIITQIVDGKAVRQWYSQQDRQKKVFLNEMASYADPVCNEWSRTFRENAQIDGEAIQEWAELRLN